jgi:GAF domain-containing protein
MVVVDTVIHTLRLPYAAIELKHDDGFYPAAVYGEPAGELLRLPLTYQGEMIGQLVLAPRRPAEEFLLTDRRLLQDIARQTGVAVHAAQLSADPQRSRQRAVTVHEAENPHRLRRNPG